MFEGFNIGNGPYINHIFDTELHLNIVPGEIGPPFAFPIDEVGWTSPGSGYFYFDPQVELFTGYVRAGTITGDINGIYPSWNGHYVGVDWLENFSIDTNLVSNPPTLDQTYDLSFKYPNGYRYLKGSPGKQKSIASSFPYYKYFYDKKIYKESFLVDLADANAVGFSITDSGIAGMSVFDGRLYINKYNESEGTELPVYWPSSGLPYFDNSKTCSLSNGDYGVCWFTHQMASSENFRNSEGLNISKFYGEIVYYVYENTYSSLESTLYVNGSGSSTISNFDSSGDGFLKKIKIEYSINVDENITTLTESDSPEKTIVFPKISINNYVDEGIVLPEEEALPSLYYGFSFIKPGSSIVENYPVLSKYSTSQGISTDAGWNVGTIRIT